PEDAVRAAAARALAAGGQLGGQLGGPLGGTEPGVELVATQALAEASRGHGRAADALRHARALRQLAGPGYPAHLAGEVLALQLADRLTDAGQLLATAGPGAGAWPALVTARMWQELALGRLTAAGEAATELAELGRDLDRPADVQLAQAAQMVITRLGGPAGSGGDIFNIEKGNRGGTGHGPADGTVGGGGFGGNHSGTGHGRAGLEVVSGDLAGLWLAVAEGRLDEGAAAARAAMRAGRERGTGWLWQPGVLRLVAQLGLAGGDRALVQQAAAMAELAALRNPGVPAFGGLACQLQGVARGDASLLGRAWEILRASPRPLVVASAAQDYGRALLTAPGTGSRAAGVRLLDDAWERFDQAGAGAARRAVERTLRQAGVRRARWAARAAEPERPGPGWGALTGAERKVAELVSSGHTNRSAASQLGLSPNTVGTHVRSIFSKLQIQSRVQLANLRHAELAQPPARILRAVWAISSLVNACPAIPQPPSGASEISTQMRSASDGSPAAAAVISVISRTTPSFLSRSSTPAGVSTAMRTWRWSPLALLSAAGVSSCTNAAVLSAKNGMSGTASQRIMQAARSWASLRGSLKVPVAAVTSIIGMVAP
ncbi:MAG: helix-turn-helix transcriptional regulator, partial [Actinobacteria bacterium]|nr:helix-turn-helix transcriptional regulator [Actinomycetota bacterium]